MTRLHPPYSERKESNRLTDDIELVGNLTQLQLGVRTEQVMVERVIIETAWFGEL